MVSTDYIKTVWRDHIVDTIAEEVIQEGTRFTANRMNNIEEGIENAHLRIDMGERDMEKLRVQLELTGRSPNNNGSFFDAINGDTPKQLILQKERAIVQTPLNPGNTVISLDDSPFGVGTYVTIYDEEQQEAVRITAKSDTSITVTALKSAFKKGAYVARTNAAMVTTEGVNKTAFGNWGTYAIQMMEVV